MMEQIRNKDAAPEDTAEEASVDVESLQAERDLLATQRHALMSVIKAHNIVFDVGEADLSALSVNEQGAVEGEFAYTAPAVQRQREVRTQHTKPDPAPKAEDEGGLSIDDVRAMSVDQINDRWDEVSAVLAGEATNGNE